ncbi:MAG: acetate--CoA ligase family protein [Phycisphaerales bacterium]
MNIIINPTKNLSSLLQPRSIAVVGASDSIGAGRNVIENLKMLGFTGKIYPVNPKRQVVLGYKCYPSINAIPDEVDCAAITIGAGQIIPVLEQCGSKGIKGAWAFASGFAETGETGKELQIKLKETCDKYNIAFCGPNCVGFANMNEHVATYSAPLNPNLISGKIGVIVQSGAICIALTDANRDIGFSKIISSGNEAVLDLTDYISYLLEDSNTEVITAFVEGFRRPERLAEVASRALELNKPIIVLKVGRSVMAQRSTAAHTGALTGSDKVQDAFFKQHGIIRVDDLDELLETAELFLKSKASLPAGDRIGMITVSGGEIGLIGDVAAEMKLSFPPLTTAGYSALKKVLPPFTNVGNPLDAWGSGDLRECYPRCMEIMAQEPDFDILAVSLDATASLAANQGEQYADVARAAVKVKRTVGKEIIAFSNIAGGTDTKVKEILDSASIPFLQGTRESLKAVKRFVEYSKVRHAKHNSSINGFSPPFEQTARLIEGKTGFLSEYDAKALLETYGIARPKELIARTEAQAVNHADEIGYPLVMKINSADIAHKTEAGGVILGVADEAGVRTAYRTILTNAKRYNPKAVLDGVLIGEMISGAVAEFIVGVNTDKNFGPVVACGMGGVLVEIFKDAALRLPPLTNDSAAAMLNEIKSSALLKGFRGRPEGDVEALVRVLVQIGRLAVDWKDHICAIDINPLFVLPKGKGVMAVDSIIELR